MCLQPMKQLANTEMICGLRASNTKGAESKKTSQGMGFWPAEAAEHYLGWVETTSGRVWSLVMCFSILDTNFGEWRFSTCRMPGQNSCRTFIPASLPMVDPRSLNVVEGDRAQYGR